MCHYAMARCVAKRTIIAQLLQMRDPFNHGLYEQDVRVHSCVLF